MARVPHWKAHSVGKGEGVGSASRAYLFGWGNVGKKKVARRKSGFLPGQVSRYKSPSEGRVGRRKCWGRHNNNSSGVLEFLIHSFSV